MGPNQSNTATLKKKEVKHVIYNDRLNMIMKYQFQEESKLNTKKRLHLMNEAKDSDFVFSPFLFDRIFAPMNSKDE